MIRTTGPWYCCPTRVGPGDRGDRERAGVLGAGLGRLVQRWEPGAQVDARRVVLVPPADRQVEISAGELHRLGLDAARSQRLQGELAGVDVPTAVVADVHDEAVLRQQPDQADELVDESVGVVNGEGEDPEVPEDAGRGLDRPRAEHTRHRGRQLLAQGDRLVLQGRGLGGAPRLGDGRRKQQRLGASCLVGVQVQPQGGGRRADLVRVAGERRQVLDHHPVLAQGLRTAVRRQVADGDPFLVRWQMYDQWPDGQRLQPPRVLRVGIAAGEPRGVDVDRAIDGDAVPVRHLDTDAERWCRESLEQVRDHVSALPGLVVLLDLEGQEGNHAVIGPRQQVVGVQVTHRVEDLRHLRVESRLGFHRVGPLSPQSDLEQTQPLQRVDRVHRGLEVQVHVVALQ